MSSICNFINKRKIVEDFIQVNPMCISNCIILLIPCKNDKKKYDQYGSRFDNLKLVIIDYM